MFSNLTPINDEIGNEIAIFYRVEAFKIYESALDVCNRLISFPSPSTAVSRVAHLCMNVVNRPDRLS